jgi:branched-chain amino acid transport system ATP-binding protein
MLLEVSRLEVRYGGIRAVKGIDLAVAEGELVCLIGANGAGKSSTLKAICRLIPSSSQKMHYSGESIARARVHELPRQGLVMVPEGRGIFPQLTVHENLAMGAYARGGGDPEAQYATFPRLKERRRQIAGTLSGGEQQMLAIGRALMSEPRLLLLDEPSMGLAPLMVAKIFEIVRDIAARGVTILLVEQNALLALEAAGRAYVMESGSITLAGEARTLLHDARIREAYLGEARGPENPPSPRGARSRCARSIGPRAAPPRPPARSGSSEDSPLSTSAVGRSGRGPWAAVRPSRAPSAGRRPCAARAR